jgi:alpha-galactosidase
MEFMRRDTRMAPSLIMPQRKLRFRISPIRLVAGIVCVAALLALTIPAVPAGSVRTAETAAAAVPPRSQDAGVRFKTGSAPVPPMGWNSWTAFGTSVTEAEVRANADIMASRLAPLGWRTVVVDIQWAEPFPKAHGYRKANRDLVLDEYGRLLPAANRFPSAAGGKGFKPLADYIHGKGLLFGIHVMRGIPRLAVERRLPVKGTSVTAADIVNERLICDWLDDMFGVDMAKPGAQAYYDSLAELYASWGVDYIKADDMSMPYDRMEEIRALSRALVRAGRPVVLSLSPGPAHPLLAQDLRRYAHLWRVTADFWDDWKSLRGAFDLARPWTRYIGPESWPDLDILPLGRIGLRAEVGEPRWTRLTRDEQATMMTLWCILRSPLMIGANLPDNDAWTWSLLTNPEALAVNQQGSGPFEVFSRPGAAAHASAAPDGKSIFLAVFNLTDEGTSDISVWLEDIEIFGRVEVRDLWARRDLGTRTETIDVRLPAHGAALYKITPTR